MSVRWVQTSIGNAELTQRNDRRRLPAAQIRFRDTAMINRAGSSPKPCHLPRGPDTAMRQFRSLAQSSSSRSRRSS